MKRSITSPLALASTAELTTAVEEARDEVGASFERFCLIAGLASLTQMLEEDATALAGAPHDPGARTFGHDAAEIGRHVGAHQGTSQSGNERGNDCGDQSELASLPW